MAWTITALDLGTLTVSTALEVRLTDFDKKIAIPVLAWLLRDGQRTILVDTGPCDLETANKYHRSLSRTPEQGLSAALRALGVDPGQVEMIINTHLHWDHCMGNNDIPDVPVLIQRSEIMYAACPRPCDKRAYEADLGFVYFNTFYRRIREVDGDADILPGIRLIHTPGHTPGSQSVVVETDKGPYVVAGDALSFFSSWTATPRRLPGVFYSVEDCYRTYARLEATGGVILPGHDPEVLRRPVYPPDDAAPLSGEKHP